jgi:hypothetical protein
MPLCDNCGVRYEDDDRGCPLCGGPPEEPAREAVAHPPSHARFREVMTFAAFSTGLIVFITDIAYGMDLSWSRIPLVTLGYLWAVLMLVSLLHRRRYLTITGVMSLSCAYLYLLGTFTGNAAWFRGTALPILVSLTVLSVLAVGAIRLFRLSVLGSISVGLVCAGLLTICIDLSVSPGASWSLVAASGVVPVIVYLANLEKRLQAKGSSLRKYFFA